jgi:hypothetical protein
MTVTWTTGQQLFTTFPHEEWMTHGEHSPCEEAKGMIVASHVRFVPSECGNDLTSTKPGANHSAHYARTMPRSTFKTRKSRLLSMLISIVEDGVTCILAAFQAGHAGSIPIMT